MPIYRFRCRDCEERFETRLSYDEFDAARVSCPCCRSERVERQLNRVQTIRNDRFSVFREADERGRSPGTDERALGTDERALGKMMREMKAESGANVPVAYDEVAERLESGEPMASIDASFSDE